jgi:hypothetical protein
MSWVKVGFLFLIALGAFWYHGQGDAAVKAIAVVYIALIISGKDPNAHKRPEVGPRTIAEREGRAEPIHTELVVEFYPRAVLTSEGYGDLGKVIRDELDSRDSAFLGEDDDRWYEMPPERMQFIFFGEPGTGNTVVWSAKYKVMLTDDCLIFEHLWHDVLEGKPEAEAEPHLVLGLHEDHSRYRMYLRHLGVVSYGGPKPTMLCEFPVGLLKDLKDKDRVAIAKEHGLTVVEGDSDVGEDDFGEPDIFYPDGKAYSIYENDRFKIKFKVYHYWNES